MSNEPQNSILNTLEAALYHVREDAWRGGPVPAELVKITAALMWIREQREDNEGGRNSMSNEQPAPLWSDENIANDAKRASSNPTIQATIRSCLLFMRHGYEAERQRLTQANAELAAEVERLKAQPSPANVWETLHAALHDYDHDLTTNQSYMAKHEKEISDLHDAYDWLDQYRPEPAPQ